MKSLVERISEYSTKTFSLELQAVLESVVSFGSYSSDKALLQILTEKCKNFILENADFANYVEKEKRYYWITRGLSESLLEAVQNLECLNNYPQLRSKVNTLKPKMEASTSPLQFVNIVHTFLNEYKWIEEVTKIYENLESEIKRFSDDIILYESVKTLDKRLINNITLPIFENIDSFLLNKNTSELPSIINSLSKFPAFANISEHIQKSYLSSKNGNSMLIGGIHSNMKIKKLISPALVLENSGNILFSAMNKFFEYDVKTKSVNETTIQEDLDNKKQKDFIKLCQLINSKTAKLNENNFSFGLNNGEAVNFVYSEESNSVTTSLNNLIIENNDFERFVLGVKPNPQFNQLIPYFRLMVENLGSFVYFDNAQIVEAVNYDNTGIIIFKNSDKALSLYKSNPSARESKMFNRLNSIQTINLVKEFLNIDITQSLREMVEVEAKTINVIDSDLKALSESINLMQQNIQRVNSGLNNPMYKEINESLDDLLINMNSELSELKQKYNKLSVKRENLVKVNENNIDSILGPRDAGFPEHTDALEYNKLENDENTFDSFDKFDSRENSDDDSMEYFSKRPQVSNDGRGAPEEELGDDEVEIEVDAMYPGENVVHKESNSVGQIVSIDYTNGIAIVDFNGDVEMKEVPIESLESARDNDNR
jgi:hypothetical protein